VGKYRPLVAAIQGSSAGIADVRYGPPVQLRPLWPSGSDLFVLRPGAIVTARDAPGGAAGVPTCRREALPAQPPGRLTHAERQRRYRARRQKVTHQGSPAPPPAAVLVPESRASAPPGEPTGTSVTEGLRCHFCGRVCGAFVRQGFLRRAAMGHPDNSHPRGGREALSHDRGVALTGKGP